MTAVSAVALVTISLFIVIQLFHFVHQRREDYAKQLESIAYSVRQPLTDAVLQGEVQRAGNILDSLLPVAFLSRADVLLPDDFQTLHANFPKERPVPDWIARVFKLPIRISIPLYSPPQTQYSAPLAHLVLQADSYRMYQFIVSTFSTMLATYLLLALIMSIAITWCINRLLIHPLRGIIVELQNLPPDDMLHRPLTLPSWHQDDELGALVRSYNRNQQLLVQSLSARTEGAGLPDNAHFMRRLEQRLADATPFSLMVFGLDSSAGKQDKVDTLAKQLSAVIEEQNEAGLIYLARLDCDEFAIIGKQLQSAGQAQYWAQNVMLAINSPFLPAGSQPARAVSVGILTITDPRPEDAALLLSQARFAMQLARRDKKSGIHPLTVPS
ncbi:MULTISPECIES: diguanylate cyclase domain-containing protein [Pectobacterium]|uniref:HAMP domain-containing protein n=1 Tax=Pectobacterium aquaticum TaxID=2204145 RepID=A0AA93DLK0_9GAMM|nr:MULTISPECIES: diguanylate cyclase [Pectobacterium]PLY36938.1 adenylate/guanylate cyclase domain-containing protein [Pectobacterium carotovorum]MCH5052084.1 diguanylate cyclase [Pectobacterium aquaticum]RRN92507.1 HAMP domain-containing protein [Pectobacterium aquaticum]RRO01389.1 HAMP domain-containing protein [Pectobacterium aquaticum]RRO03621.1 HAMP domain-containing protein [Pectobacterium aquaticum]